MLRKKQCVRLALCCLLLGTVCSFACRKSSSSSAASQRPNTTAVGKETEYRDASDTFFEHPSIPKIVLKVSVDQEAKLNENARQYVKCTLIENGAKEFIEVGLKLKGAAGSFQDLSGKPAFTINVSKFHKKQTFHELEKFHLNNSVQDELYTNEWLCSTICRDAGLPAARVSHARVWFNDRDLGLYVLKEGFDRRFLNRHFSDPTGNLYDGGFCQDIDVDLEKDSGDGCSDNSDIHALKEACCESEPKLRTGKLMQHLNFNAFQTFMAIEMMCCHWDGYVSNRNNYRIYFSSNTNRAHFFPHGMDQMFQDPGFQTFGHTPAMVASSLRSDPELNLQFRNRVAELLPLFEGSRLASRVQTLQQKLRSEFANLNPEGLEDIDRKIAELVDRLRERHRNIIQHLAQPDPPIPDPSTDDVYAVGELGVGEIAMISDWHPIQETEQAQLERLEPEDNHDAMIPPVVVYTIAVGDADECVASWRKTVLLPAGRYAFVAELRVEDVVERVQDDRGRGAGLRISGANRENNLLASSEWSSLKFEFQITEEQQAVQLVSELRAIKGKMAMRNPGIIRTSP